MAAGWLFATEPARAQNTTVPGNSDPVLHIGQTFDHAPLSDVMLVSQTFPETAEINAVITQQFEGSFDRPGSAVPSFRGEDGVVWIKASLVNTGSETANLNAVIKYPNANRIDLYLVKGGEILDHRYAGAGVAYHPAMTGRFPNIGLALEPDEKATVYARLDGSGPIIVPFQVSRRAEFLRSMTRDYLIFGLLAGSVLAIAIHAGLTFWATREPAFGWFVLFSLSGATFIVMGTGIVKALLLREAMFNSNAIILAVQGISTVASSRFLATYLQTKITAPKLDKVIWFITFAGLVSSLSSFLPDLLVMPLLFVGLLLGPIVLFGTAVLLSIRGVEGARSLVLGWSFTLAGTAWIFMRSIDLVPYSEFNHYALPLAATFTALQFSYALTSRARKAEHQATHDPLTGMQNRLNMRVKTAKTSTFARRVTAVMQIDLDGFKQINDKHGHAAGDDLLKAVAQRIKASSAGVGEAFRMGGDEFVILCEGKEDTSSLATIANRIISEISKPVNFRGMELSVGASIGLALVDNEAEPLADVIERADHALYNSKRTGKGRVSLCNLASERALLHEAFETEAAAKDAFAA